MMSFFIKNGIQLEKFVMLFACALLLFSIAPHLNLPILEAHGFRQTQTAITAYYIDNISDLFYYETPVLGYPWRIPFEFPLYQYITKIVSIYTGIELTLTGRLISLFFFIGIIYALKEINNELKLIDNRNEIFFFLIVALNPVYLFWSATFMIESTALFFSLMVGLYVIKLRLNYSYKNLFFLFIYMLTAGLVKLTTVAPIILLSSVIFIFFCFEKHRVFNFIQIICIVGVVSIALSIVYFWISYSDLIKSENFFGKRITSSALSRWNYGEFGDRFSKDLWVDVIWKRDISSLPLSYFSIFFIIFGFFISRKCTKIYITLLTALYILPYAVFTNLHLVHDYYQYSNRIYLISIFILTTFTFFEKIKKVQMSYLRSTFLISATLVFLNSNYTDIILGKKQTFEKELNISNFIKHNTKPDDLIIVFGYDWASKIHFYSERKGLAFPGWGGDPKKILDNEKSFLNGELASIIVNCKNKHFKLIQEHYIKYEQNFIYGCELYKR